MIRHLFKLILFTATFGTAGWADEALPVTVNEYVRARTDLKFKEIGTRNGFGTITHIRRPTTPDRQTVVRMNRDTLYSSAVVDLSKDVFADLPAGSGRYVSLHVINQDHYSRVHLEPRTYRLTQQDVGTRYAFLIWRIFVNGDDSDTKQANTIQDRILLRGGGTDFKFPNWDPSQVDDMTATLAKLSGDLSEIPRAFGLPGEVDPEQHRIGAAMAWGGMPRENAVYLYETPKHNDGRTRYELLVRDVPVNAFWSVTVYNDRGWLIENPADAYSLNSESAKAEDDGSFLIRFGGDKDAGNSLPISPGWNYTVRLYEPQQAILNGNWTFPKATVVPRKFSEP